MSRAITRTASALASLIVGFVIITTGVSSQVYVGGAPPAGGKWAAQPSTKNGEWPHYTADVKGNRYSPLDQINASNFSKLEVAWRYKTDNLGPRPEYKLEGTPLMVKGVLYTTGGTRRSVIALDAKTGEQIWVHSLREGKRAAVSPRQLSGRGVSYWTDGKGDDRVLYVTTGYRLVAINANVGVWTQITVDEDLGLVYLPVETPSSDYYGGHRPGDNLFAESLVCVDLKTGQRKWHFQLVHHPIWNFDMSSAPILADVTIDAKPRKVVAVPSKQGWLYVFDRVTGQPVWPIVERPVPQSDVPGEKTSPTQPHPPDKLLYARNYVQVPEDVIDFTPQMRAEALERLKRYKVGTSPFTPAMLGDINGLVGAVGAGTATNWPGGGYDPETHIVYAPAGNLGFSARSLVAPPAGFSDIRYVSGIAGQEFHEVLGPGDCCAADSPRTAQRAREALRLADARSAQAPPAEAARPAGSTSSSTVLVVQGLPIVKPPYGVLSAINLDRGELMWQAPHGDTPDDVRNHPALKGLNIPKTGQAGTQGVGLLVTKTLVVMGDPQVTTTTEHPRGAMLRAYDKATGREVGAVWMPAPQSGSPMTYTVDGKQFIVVAVSGGPYSGEYLAFGLPEIERRTSSQQP